LLVTRSELAKVVVFVCVDGRSQGDGGGIYMVFKEVRKLTRKLQQLGDQVVNKYRSKGTFVISRHM
jgi:hypothetical protein